MKQSSPRLPTTYANRKNDKQIFAAWDSYVGRWISRDGSGEELISVALTPRLPRPGKDKLHGTLTGFIPRGEYEGVLFFKSGAETTDGDKGLFIKGTLYKADRNLTRLETKLLLVPPAQTPRKEWGKKRLILQIKKKRKKKEYLLDWVHDVNDTALSKVCIIGHRGLGFAGLDNSPKAFRHAWYFGASGIEFDIAVPYKYYLTRTAEQCRFPLTHRLVVYHPPLHNQTCDEDWIPKEFSPANRIFQALKQYWVPFVYVDAKVKWLSADRLEEVLERISRFADVPLRRGNLIVTIAAYADQAAKFFGGTEAFQSSPHFAKARLSWTLGWTEVVKAKDILARAQKPPFALSFNVRKIDGSMKRSLTESLLDDVSKKGENEMKEKTRILIFWIANDDEHFKELLCATKELMPRRRFRQPGEIGIMTDYPHRLAYWLAT